jgi:hypothetical protein
MGQMEADPAKANPGVGIILGPVALNRGILWPDKGAQLPSGPTEVIGYAFAGEDRIAAAPGSRPICVVRRALHRQLGGAPRPPCSKRGSGPHQRDEVGCVDRPPAGQGGFHQL